MATNKTQPTQLPIADYLAAIEDNSRRSDCETLVKLMQQLTKQAPVIWGNGNESGIFSNMVGFGNYHYKYASGTEGDWFLTGFAMRKADITIYVMSGFEDVPELMAKLGKFKNSKGCLYIKKLADIDQDVLAKLIKQSVRNLKAKYP